MWNRQWILVAGLVACGGVAIHVASPLAAQQNSGANKSDKDSDQEKVGKQERELDARYAKAYQRLMEVTLEQYQETNRRQPNTISSSVMQVIQEGAGEARIARNSVKRVTCQTRRFTSPAQSELRRAGIVAQGRDCESCIAWQRERVASRSSQGGCRTGQSQVRKSPPTGRRISAFVRSLRTRTTSRGSAATTDVRGLVARKRLGGRRCTSQDGRASVSSMAPSASTSRSAGALGSVDIFHSNQIEWHGELLDVFNVISNRRPSKVFDRSESRDRDSGGSVEDQVKELLGYRTEWGKLRNSDVVILSTSCSRHVNLKR